jgi:tricorn protease
LYLYFFRKERAMGRRIFVLMVLGILCLSAAASAAPESRLMRYPDIYGDKIVFTHGGDLWIVSTNGGTATRLTSHPGSERFAKFSPDGKSIAFTGVYDGNTDVFAIPTEGGIPKRLTYHPFPEYSLDWTPSGDRVLFRSVRESKTNPGPRYSKLFTVPKDGGVAEALPLFEGELACYSPDGSKIAFTRLAREFRTWKHYRGGMAPNIWTYDFKTGKAELVVDSDGNDMFPMWYGNNLYFISDREHTYNVYVLDLGTKKVRKLTNFDEYDVKWPSIGDGAIVFENGGLLYVLDLKTEKSRKVDISVPSELTETRPRYERVAGLINAGDLSGAGKRAAFEARGDIFTVPAEKGVFRNVTNTQGVRERAPAFSPDGKWIAYFSDATGDYDIYMRKPDGTGEEVRVTKGIGHYPFRMSWSPDSKKLAFYDETFHLYYVDIDKKQVETVDVDPWSDLQDYSWSSDGKWIAYSKNGDNGNSSIYFYSLDEKKPRRMTSGLYNDYNPCFSTDGKYLFFISNRATAFEFDSFDFDINYVYPSVICAVTLKADTPSPLAPESDEVEVKEDKKDEGGTDADKKDEKKADTKKDKKKDAADDKKDADKKDEDADKALVIDFDGFESRIIGLPVGRGNFGGLYPGDKKLFYADAPNRPIGAASDEDGGGGFDLKFFDFDKRESKTALSGITNYTFSADGKKILYQARQVYGIVDAGEGKKVGDGTISTGELDMRVDPPAEWKQMFTEAWRLERDFFYVNNMHGMDWNKMRSRYEALLPYVTGRDDLNYIIGELISELNAGHAYVGGGDYPNVARVGTGLLGCDFEADKASGRYRIAKIYGGRNWDPTFAGPLGQPGLNVHEGDFILAINGVELKYPADPIALLEDRAGKQTVIKVAKAADGKDARDVTVEPVPSDINLRYADWVESNRLKVLDASGGKIGYVHVPNTATEGLMEFAKLFYGQSDLDGIIIDERWNSGGWMPSLFVDRLAKKPTAYWALRHFKKLRAFPPAAVKGYEAMLINEWSGSGGDAFPFLFREAGLGPLIGKRTWGGLVGMNRSIPLADGGGVTMPGIGFIDLQGNYAVENQGISPDIEVENSPDLTAKGLDPQLDKAIEVLMAKIKANPPKTPPIPKEPDKH